MEDLHRYVERYREQSFEQLPLNEVDIVNFTQVVYLPFDEALPKGKRLSFLQAAQATRELQSEKFYEIFFRKRLQLFREMADTARYRDVVLSDFVQHRSLEEEKQFCAITFTLPSGLRLVCFRGTDDTLVGWKENFNMSFQSPVPAQAEAVGYVECIGAQGPGPVITLGHSKGGNLALWCAAFCIPALQNRVHAVYTIDSPGLMQRDVERPGYLKLQDRIHSFLPQESLVGVLMNTHDPYRVVNSKTKSLLQHDVFSWEVEKEEPRFVYREELSQKSRLIETALDEWLSGVSLQERQLFCDAVYEVVTAAEDTTLAELVWSGFSSTGKIYKALQNLDPDIRKMMDKLLQTLYGRIFNRMKAAALEGVKNLLPVGKDEDQKGKSPLA